MIGLMSDTQEDLRKSGIYVLKSKHDPGHFYVGSAVRLGNRYMRHCRELLAGTHFNPHLQNHVNKYGLDDLLFEIVEICPRHELLLREQFYIDQLVPFFNINPIAGSRLGSKHSIKTKLRISRSWKNRVPISVSTRYARYLK